MRAKKVLISISSRPAFGASCDHGGRGVGRTIGQSPRQALSSAIRVRSQSRGPPWPRVGSESRTTSATDRTRRPITGLELEGLPQGGAEGSRTPGFTTLSSRYDISIEQALWVPAWWSACYLAPRKNGPPGGRSIRETKPISAKPAPQRSRDLKRLQPLHSRTVQPRSNCHQTATAAGRRTSGGV